MEGDQCKAKKTGGKTWNVTSEGMPLGSGNPSIPLMCIHY